MPPKNKFSKEQIVDAAFTVKEYSIQAIRNS